MPPTPKQLVLELHVPLGHLVLGWCVPLRSSCPWVWHPAAPGLWRSLATSCSTRSVHVQLSLQQSTHCIGI